jgi:alpha-amylase/alpha-mannosidase (GH57 family)
MTPMSIQGFCIHGHFYQPPREDSLTGVIPVEPGALPYRNWNERIHDQCYRPNAVLRNYEHISFNFGPTLLAWMEKYDPDTVAKIVAQDRTNYEAYGVGNAMAQAFNHTILPLAPRRAKETQIRWGIADFVHRFGHQPSGLWLPETAVDNETLEVLVENGIEFTILAPWQADTSHLNTTHPYWVELPGDKRIAVFFYDQKLSTSISFNPGATINADDFVVNYLKPEYSANGNSSEPQLVMVASDGELYGHHQQFRDKFLSYLMGGALSDHDIQTTYPGLWLKQHPPKKSIQIRQFTSWSCHHGVTRWMGPCGCTPHGEWKAQMRQAFRAISDMIEETSAVTGNALIKDWWELKNEYIHVLLGEIRAWELINKYSLEELEEDEICKIELLLRANVERQRMFTSCGWFFDDYDRIEPKNNTAYAAQAVWLVQKATGIDLSERAMAWLKPVKSWKTSQRADIVFNHYLQRTKTASECRD